MGGLSVDVGVDAGADTGAGTGAETGAETGAGATGVATGVAVEGDGTMGASVPSLSLSSLLSWFRPPPMAIKISRPVQSNMT